MIESLDFSIVDVPLHTLVQLGFYVVAGLYSLFTMILYYHWNEYSTNAAMSRLTAIVYLTTTLPVIAALSILTFFIY